MSLFREGLWHGVHCGVAPLPSAADAVATSAAGGGPGSGAGAGGGGGASAGGGEEEVAAFSGSEAEAEERRERGMSQRGCRWERKMRTTARIRMMVAKRMGRVMATGEGIFVDRRMCVCVRWGGEEGDAWMRGEQVRGRGRGARYSHSCSCFCGVNEALHQHVHESSKGDETVVGMVILCWRIVAGQQC